MSENKMRNTSSARGGSMRRGPMGGGHMPGAVEKPKNFKTAMIKVAKYMKKDVTFLVIAMLLAIGGVILTINIPNILGNATDELILGVMKGSVYDTAVEMKEGLSSLKTSIDAMDEQQREALLSSDATIGDLPINSDNLDDSLKSIKVSVAYAMAEHISEAKTFGDLFQYAPSSAIDNIPEKYRQVILDTSLEERPGVDIDKIVGILGTIILLLALSFVLSYTQSFIMADISQKVSYRFRRDIEKKINRMPLSYFDKRTHGEVMSYITNDVDTLSTSLSQSLSQLVTSLVTVVGVLVMMIRISVWMTLAALLLLPLSLGLITTIVKRSQKHFTFRQEHLSGVNGHIEEMYGGHMVVKLNNGEQLAQEKFDELNDKLYDSSWKSQFFSGMMMPIMNVVGNLGYVLVCVLGGYLTVQGNITVGNIQAFVQYVRQFNQPIAQLANITNTMQSAAAAAERVFDFLEEKEEAETGSRLPAGTDGHVRFDHVRFGYSDDKIIIHDFSADIKAGQRVAIVGPTGAGKTTMVKLLMRFYDMQGGKIFLDGVDITQYERAALRREFGMVLQDTWLYNSTIRENIRYGNLDATDEQVIKAAKAACAHHFIKTLPGGYDFVINEEAENISHGQRQLLTIARAILSDPRVLILDEATSSVDTRTEMLIQQAMGTLMQGKTSFIIAHRLSTIKDADLILVMRDGDVVEKGTHEQLLNQNGFYASLYKSQFEQI